MSFPNVLDNAKVLYYTPQEYYGELRYTTGEIAEHICYLAICKYNNTCTYYLFACNENYEVVSDSPWRSIDECMKAARDSYDCDTPWTTVN